MSRDHIAGGVQSRGTCTRRCPPESAPGCNSSLTTLTPIATTPYAMPDRQGRDRQEAFASQTDSQRPRIPAHNAALPQPGSCSGWAGPRCLALPDKEAVKDLASILVRLAGGPTVVEGHWLPDLVSVSVSVGTVRLRSPGSREPYVDAQPVPVEQLHTGLSRLGKRVGLTALGGSNPPSSATWPARSPQATHVILRTTSSGLSCRLSSHETSRQIRGTTDHPLWPRFLADRVGGCDRHSQDSEWGRPRSRQAQWTPVGHRPARWTDGPPWDLPGRIGSHDGALPHRGGDRWWTCVSVRGGVGRWMVWLAGGGQWR